MEGHSDVGSSVVIVSFGSDAGSIGVGGFTGARGESEDGLQVAFAIRFCTGNNNIGFIRTCIIDIVVDAESLTSSTSFAWQGG